MASSRSAAAETSPVRRKAPAKRPVRRGGRFTEERRKEIIEEAAQLFIERGYENVTIDDIVERIGGSKATVYSRFGGKDELFATVIKAHCARVVGALDTHEDPTDPLADQLRTIGTAFLDTVLRPETIEQHRLMVSIGKKFPDVGNVFYDAGPRSASAAVSLWVQRQQKAGRLIAGDPYRLATLFLDMLTGEHQLARLVSVDDVSNPQTVAATVDLAVQVFLRGTETAPRAGEA